MVRKRMLLLLIVLFSSGSLTAANNALDFDGIDDYVASNGTATTLSGSTTLTMEAWFNSANVSSSEDQMILAFNDATSGNISQLYIETGARTLKYSGASTNGTGSVLKSDTWYHVAMTLDASNNLKVYLNGIEDISTTEADRPGSSDRFSIGQEWDNSTASNFFYGKIDEIRIWNDVRTQAEIRANMYQELVGTESNLVAYYNCNASSGISLTDNSTNSNTGTLTNMTDSDWTTSSAYFGPKNYLDFDGADDYVGCGSINLDSSPITLECWVNVDLFQSVSPYISSLIGQESETSTALLRLGDAALAKNKVQFVLYIGSTQTKLDGITALVADTWYHIAGVYDGAEMKIYINGKLDASKNQMGNIVCNGNFVIATNDDISRCLDGSIDEVRIWNDVRTQAEIRENMCSTLTGNESNLVAYYNFDNTSGTTLQDFSANTQDGTLTNMESADWVSSTAFNTWLNTDNSTWSTASNWSGGVPASTDNVGIYDYSGGTPPTLSGTPTVNNLVVGSTADLSLSSNVTVNGNLFLYDDLDLNGRTITLGSSATLYEDSGNILGTSGTIQTTRDLYNINEDVAGLGAEITTSANMGSTTIIRGHTAQGTQGINRYYWINPASNSGLSATLVFKYLENELNEQSEPSLKLFKSSDGSNWTEQSSTIETTNNTLTLNDIDSFSYWTAAPSGSDASLPVELTSFTASRNDRTIVLNWVTESEIENLGFIIERSENGSAWNEIASYKDTPALAGQGNVTSRTEYNYSDMAISDGVKYGYRLADVSYGGDVKYHQLKSGIRGSESALIPAVFTLNKNYPNPFNPSTVISWELADAGAVTVTVYDINGRLVTELLNAHQSAGNHQVSWDGSDQLGYCVSGGMYFYQIKAGDFVQTRKMILLK